MKLSLFVRWPVWQRKGFTDEDIEDVVGQHRKRPDRFWNEELATMIERAGELQILGPE